MHSNDRPANGNRHAIQEITPRDRAIHSQFAVAPLVVHCLFLKTPQSYTIVVRFASLPRRGDLVPGRESAILIYSHTPCLPESSNISEPSPIFPLRGGEAASRFTHPR